MNNILTTIFCFALGLAFGQQRTICYGISFEDIQVGGERLYDIVTLDENLEKLEKLGTPIDIKRYSDPAYSSIIVSYKDIELTYFNMTGSYELSWAIWNDNFNWDGNVFYKEQKKSEAEKIIRDENNPNLKSKNIEFKEKNVKYKDEDAKFGLDEEVDYKSYLEFVYDEKGKLLKAIIRFNHL